MGNKLRETFNSQMAKESFKIIFKNEQERERFVAVIDKIQTGEINGLCAFDGEYGVVHQQRIGEDLYSDDEAQVVSMMVGPAAEAVEIPVCLNDDESVLRILKQRSAEKTTLRYLDNPLVEFEVSIDNALPSEIRYESKIHRDKSHSASDIYRAYDELYGLINFIMNGKTDNDQICRIADTKAFWKRVVYVEENCDAKFDIQEMDASDGAIIDKLYILLKADFPISHPQNAFKQTLTKGELDNSHNSIVIGGVMRLVWTEARIFHVFNQDISLDVTRIIPFATVEQIDTTQEDKVVITYGPGEYELRLIEQLAHKTNGDVGIDSIGDNAVDFMEYCGKHFYSSYHSD